MAQVKTIYTCQNCGAQSPKWIGKCPSCNEWNSYIEEVITKKQSTGKLSVQISDGQIKLIFTTMDYLSIRKITIGTIHLKTS